MNTRPRPFGLLVLVLMLTFPLTASAQLQLSRLISDGMVMQRSAEVPVWGWATPGARLAIIFNGATYTARADADGAWKVTLPPMDAGGPYTLRVSGDAGQVEVENILVGDVWVASGQSNMEWTVANANNADAEIAAADDPLIRHFKVPLSWAEEPEATLAGGAWEAADPEHVGNFSAVGYFFARELREHIDVPIGLINTSWGGSRIEPWMSAEALDFSEADLDAMMEQERAAAQAVLDRLRAKIGDFPEQDEGLVNGQARWAAPDLDDAGWTDIDVPALWEQAGYEGMDGIAWYRTTINLTEEEVRTGIRLGLGTIDDSDISWMNGHEIGRTEQAYAEPRVYDVPASALQPGPNVIAVRVEDTGGGGGIYGDPNLLYLEADGTKRPLAGTWKFKVGAVSVNPQGNQNQKPTLLYNKMVYPLLPYPIAGVIWYQGESNANTLEDAVAYRQLFADMIRNWRADWNQSDLPFLFVQLANYMEPQSDPNEASAWAVLRESQTAALDLPHTGQAVIIDIGEADDIHPRNKQDVGRRLALTARKVVYGEDNIVYSGPVYRNHDVQDGRVIITFDHVGSSLVAQGTDGDVNGFAIAGAGGNFVWADARIEGDRVVVWSDHVPNPVAVRYAWADNPVDANLYNEEGLPASPFRTDRHE